MQGRESSSIKSTAKQLTPEQRAAKLSSLRSQRQSWRDSTTEYRNSQKSQHLKLLQEGIFALHDDMILLCLRALSLKIIFYLSTDVVTTILYLLFLSLGVGIYYRNKLDNMRKIQGKVTEDMANASILADLQQKQDAEFDSLLPGLYLKVFYHFEFSYL